MLTQKPNRTTLKILQTNQCQITTRGSGLIRLINLYHTTTYSCHISLQQQKIYTVIQTLRL